jgi:hypothetical protein
MNSVKGTNILNLLGTFHSVTSYETLSINYSYMVPVTTDASPMNMYYSNNNLLGNIGAVSDRAKYQDLEADGFRLGKEELNLLVAQLLGSQAEQKQGFSSKEIIRLNLFGVEEEKS